MTSASDSTPTAVTVSDRMREMVEEYGHACHWMGLSDKGSGQLKAQCKRDEAARLATVLREIGWLETVIDQRGKRIQELEKTPGWKVHPRQHDPNEYRNAGDLPTPESLAAQVYDRGEAITVEQLHALSEPSSPPQTRGEAMPEIVAQVIDSLQKRLASDDDEVWGILETAATWLAKDRSRLLTALEEKEREVDELRNARIDDGEKCLAWAAALDEKEREHAEAREAWGLDYLAMVKHRDDLQSASVLQKEELEKIRGQRDDFARKFLNKGKL